MHHHARRASLAIGFIACLLIRLIPFRPPNVEPILAAQMPFSKTYGPLVGFLFAFLGIVSYDLITARFGIWTLITAAAYGALGVWAALYFKSRKGTTLNYAKFAVIGTLAFDIVTGLSIGPLFFGQPFIAALIGQLPFTALHLVGNVAFAVFLSPVFHALAVREPSPEHRLITSTNLHHA